MTKKISIYYENKKIDVLISKTNIKIINSFEVKDKKDMKKILKKILTLDFYLENRDRTIVQYLKEWRTHNILYNIPIKYFKNHCKDCDLTVKENKFRLLVYYVLGIF